MAWLVGLLLTSLVLAITAKAESWVVVSLLASVGITVGLYMGAYVFCLVVDRDALRSERYTLHKMAIEAGVYGDNKTGLIEITPQTRAVPGQAAIRQSATTSEGPA